MIQIRKGIFGAMAISLTIGAIPFAFGHELVTGQRITPAASGTGINRAVKADRATVQPAGAQTRTIALRLDSLTDSSILIRIPVAEEARSRPAPQPQLIKSGDRKRAVACEPVVSVLTEIAKQLEPGRCIT